MALGFYEPKDWLNLLFCVLVSMNSLQLGAKDKAQALKFLFGIDHCIYTILIILQSSVDMNHSKT